MQVIPKQVIIKIIALREEHSTEQYNYAGSGPSSTWHRIRIMLGDQTIAVALDINKESARIEAWESPPVKKLLRDAPSNVSRKVKGIVTNG